ncbi:hypothetical protein HanPSC8_Chr10g0409091 [Helianthus annuus]|nr:hypothetical protein HanPSC8_Chr10g0409091 [Helianthus annuus]
MGSPLIFLWVHFGFLNIISARIISKRNGFLGTRKDLCRNNMPLQEFIYASSYSIISTKWCTLNKRRIKY